MVSECAGEVPESIPNMNNSGDEENPFAAAAASSDGEESIKATLLVSFFVPSANITKSRTHS